MHDIIVWTCSNRKFGSIIRINHRV